MPAIVISTEVERPGAEVFAYARPSLTSWPVDAQKVPVRPQHKPTCQRRGSHGATEQSPER
jgi:hypothetical protein